MKKRLCLLLLPLVLLGCTSEPDKPADLISEEKMTQILMNIHITEAILSRTTPNYDTSRVVYKREHKSILRRHDVSDSAFQHSYNYYLKYPAKLDKIYEAVLDSLSLREAKMTPKEAQPDTLKSI